MAFLAKSRVLSRNLISRLVMPSPVEQCYVAILCFHDICQDMPHDLFSVEFDRFRTHIDRLMAGGLNIISLDQAVSGTEMQRRQSVVITFDDGYESVVTLVAPMLESIGLPLIIAVTTGYLGRPGYLTEAMLKDLSEHPLIEIASHGVTHRSLTSLSQQEIYEELSFSKLEIERITRRRVRWIAYPFGHVDDGVKSLVRRIGYQGALGTSGTRVHIPIMDLYDIPRLTVYSVDRPCDVLAKARGQHDWFPVVKRRIRRLSGTIY